MVEEMTNRGFRRQFIKLKSHFLKSRCLKTSVLGIEKTRYLAKGCPQGSCLSPLAWNVAFDKLLCNLNHGGTNELTIGFTDDGVALIKGKDIVMMQRASQKTLEQGDAFGVKFCPEKNTTMMFGYTEQLDRLHTKAKNV